MRSHYLVHSSKTPTLTTSSAAHRMPHFQHLMACGQQLPDVHRVLPKQKMIRQHSWKSIFSWGIAQKDDKLKMARIGSNGDVYQMFETRLGILVQTLIWKTSKHGQRGAILLFGRELVRGLRGTRTFHLFLSSLISSC